MQRVVDVQDGLEEMEAVTVMRQVLEALVFLHDHNIAHLDLKVSHCPFVSRREMLAIVVEGVIHYKDFLYGKKFLVRTDHSA